jgi:hypothetical protein
MAMPNASEKKVSLKDGPASVIAFTTYLSINRRKKGQLPVKLRNQGGKRRS